VRWVSGFFIGSQASIVRADPSLSTQGRSRSMIFTNPMFWLAVMVIGVIALFIASKMGVLNSTAVAVAVSLLISVAYFNLVDHYLMDMQGLDYWYMFRK
jgi:hypothetical protein